MKNTIVIPLVVAVLVGAASFYGGMKYQESKGPSFQMMTGQNGNFQGRMGNGQGQSGTRMIQGATPITGEIIEADDTGITVKMEDGSTKIVIVSGSTTINKASQGTKTDLVTGERVAAFGTANSDGSITAQSIQLNPQTRMFRGQGGTPMPTGTSN